MRSIIIIIIGFNIEKYTKERGSDKYWYSVSKSDFYAKSFELKVASIELIKFVPLNNCNMRVIN
jgi:hypothetical protein